MATQTIKSTYSLDVETVRTLETLARRWRVSKSEALRRAIRASATGKAPHAGREALEALDQLQQSLALDAKTATVWEKSARGARRAASRRREAKAE
jgi:Zn-dependent peptidase ImmA (M78 family)